MDDAQVNQDTLASLRHLRREIDVDFDIVATCWPGDEAAIQEALGIESAKVRRLFPLTRNQVVKVVHASGLSGPNGLVREIVTQAGGQPGLAVTLALLCIRGDMRKVVFADAIKRSMTEALGRLVGPQATSVLAAFSLGGTRGMPVGVVAHQLGMNSADIMSIATALATGGVLSDARTLDGSSIGSAAECFVVRPTALRVALVRDTFFGARPKLAVGDFLERVPDLACAAECLIAARSRNGRQVPDELIQKLFPKPEPDPVIDYRLPLGDLEEPLKKVAFLHQWRSIACRYALLGPQQAKWSLSRNPEIIDEIASILLDVAPGLALAHLLKKAHGDNRELGQTPSHPVRLIREWIRRARGPIASSLRRRRRLLTFCEANMLGTREPSDVLQLACIALSPMVEFNETDPGAGRTVTFGQGHVSEPELIQLRRLWPRVLGLLHKMPETRWGPIFDILGEYVHPMSAPDDCARQMRASARQLLRDLLPLAANHPGRLHRLKQLAPHARFKIPVSSDPEFDLLYDEGGCDDWDAQERRRTVAIRELALRLSARGAQRGAQRLREFQHEAVANSLQSNVHLHFLCDEISRTTQDRVLWFEELLRCDCSTDMLRPFVQREIAQREPAGTTLATRLLGESTRAILAVEAVVLFEDPASDLFDNVLKRTEDVASCIGRLRGQLDEVRSGRLLSHPNSRVSNAAALHEWLSAPHHEIRASLRDAWHRAVVGSRTRLGHQLKNILESNRDMAADWLVARLGEDWGDHYDCDTAIAAAIKILTRDERLRVLTMVQPGHWSINFLKEIVGNSSRIYERFLTIESKRQIHLIPLRSSPESIRCSFLLLALRAGYSLEEVAEAIDFGEHEITGERSEYLRRWVVAFEELASCSIPQLRRIGRFRLPGARRACRRAYKDERREAVFG